MKKYKMLPLSAAVIAAIASSGTYANDFVLEEILVTAQKRVQSLQDVPISVNALSGEDLQKRGLTSIKDYSNFVSGMVFSGTSNVGERSGPDITVRGVANSRLFDFETSIATATTGFVYGQMPAYSFDPRLMDVNRVEVLKGPQGTLYGAASMGGTVIVIPNAPDAQEFSAKFGGGLSYTNDGDQNHEFNGFANIPIIEDVLAFRLSGFSALDSGYIDARMVTGSSNESRGRLESFSDGFDSLQIDVYNVDEPTRNYIENINEVDIVGGTAALRYTPNEKLDITASYFFQSKDERSMPNATLGLSGDFNERVTELYILQPSSTDYGLGQLEISYDLGFADIISVTGGLNRKFTNVTDFSAVVYGVLGGDGTASVPGTSHLTFSVDTDVFSQEFRLVGVADVASGLNWSVGYFYQTEDRLAYGSVPLSASWMSNGGEDGLLPRNGTNLVWAGEYDSEYDNQSFFFDVSLALTERLEVSIGARYSEQELSSVRIDFGDYFAGGATPTSFSTVEQEINESQTTPRATVSFAVTDDVNLYATASQGFRIGGANPEGNLDTPQCQNALDILGISNPGTFESDDIWNYEIGMKGLFVDNRVEVNLSAFQVIWSDLQVATTLITIDDGCGASVVSNIGEAELKGIEVEVRALVTENFEVAFVAEFNDAELSESSEGVPGASVGDPLKNVPDYSLALGLQYNFTVMGGEEAYARLDYIYMDDRSFADVAAGPSDATNLPSYDLVNFRFGARYENWEFTAFVDNLTDETPQNGVSFWPGGPGIYASGDDTQTFSSIGRPRTIGLKVDRYF